MHLTLSVENYYKVSKIVREMRMEESKEYGSITFAINVLVKAFQEFNSAYLITKGGPNNSTYFLNLYIYDQAFKNGNYGYASALTWILLLIIGVLTLIIFKSSDHWVYYNN